ncbi:DUF2255 family protein [Nonomuraea angiospora]|uniref:DUF2255 family protein n=1 Tax=Nonomuraea angiospora TaxID=46172 RepID=UPI00345082F6
MTARTWLITGDQVGEAIRRSGRDRDEVSTGPVESSTHDRTALKVLASRRADGSLRRPVTMWVVRVGDDLYVRCMNGRAGAWYRGAQTRHQGRITAGIGGVVNPESRAATIELISERSS